MPIKAVQRFTAWSFSRLSDYEDCPFKAKLKHLDKKREPDSPAMKRGTDIHADAQRFSIGADKVLPESLKLFADEFKGLRKRKSTLAVEQQVAFNAKWEPVDWFSPEAWVRVVLDCTFDATFKGSGLVRVVIDYKTGKIREESLEQLDLYAIASFSNEGGAKIKRCDAELWYLDAGEIKDRSYTREGAEALKKTWGKRVAPMMADTTFKPKPGNACRWCFHSKSKGGPCKY